MLWSLNFSFKPTLPWSIPIALLIGLWATVYACSAARVAAKRLSFRQMLAVTLYGLPTMLAFGFAFALYWSQVKGAELHLGSLLQLPAFVVVAFMVSDAILHGVIEECAFRGLLQDALMKVLRPWAAIFAVTICFLVAHLPGLPDFRMLPYWAFLSTALGYVAYRAGSFVPAAVLHTAHNLVAYLFVATGTVSAVSRTHSAYSSGVASILWLLLSLAVGLLAVLLLRRLLVAYDASSAMRQSA